MGKTAKENWEAYKKRISPRYGKNAILQKQFLNDFENGLNVGKVKGSRAPNSLLRLGKATETIFKLLANKPFSKALKEPAHRLFNKMKEGEVKKSNGERYKDVSEYVKDWKVFCGWAHRTGKIDEDISSELSVSHHKGIKPAWVYLGHEKMKKLIDNSRGDYRVFILFLYDSGLRPQEAWKITISDFSENFSVLNIPEKRENGERLSKTFERTIKLKHSSQLIKQFVEMNNLKSSDYLIRVTQPAFNKYLKANVLKIFNEDVTTKARGKLSQIKAYDIRHNSVCYWIDKYKTNKDLMYRFGWLREDKVFYYSEFLGRRDKIDDEDMMTKEDKTQLELEVGKLKQDLIDMKDNNEHLNKALWYFFEKHKDELKSLKIYLPK